MISIAKCNNSPLGKTREKDLNNQPRLIDGLDVLDTLCPVNEKTGLRENTLSLIRKLVNDPVKARLLESLISEIPSDNSMNQLTDEQRADMLAMRFDCGTPNENERFRENLLTIVESLNLPSDVKSDVESSDKINFEKSDTQIVDEV